MLAVGALSLMLARALPAAVMLENVNAIYVMSRAWARKHRLVAVPMPLSRASQRKPMGQVPCMSGVVHARRKTVTAMDVVYALKRQGRTLYGFGG